MEDCIFCKIIKGEIPCAKIWEDENFLAILDAFPNTKGMTLVMPKNHHDSYIFSMSDDTYQKFFLAVKNVSLLLEKALDVKRVAVVVEGLGVNHAHIKLYPIYGLEKEFEETWAKDRIYFERYEGYISTQLGPQANREELNKLAEEIRKKI